MPHPFIKTLELINSMESGHINSHHGGVFKPETYHDCEVCQAIKGLRNAIYNYPVEPQSHLIPPEAMLGMKVVTNDWLPDNGVFYVHSNTLKRWLGQEKVNEDVQNLIKAAIYNVGKKLEG